MQVSNNTHYSSDAYLISKKQYEAEHKSEPQPKDEQSDISITKLEEESYAKSINALQPQQVASVQNSSSPSNQSGNNTNSSDTGIAAEKAITSYNEVENNQTPQAQFNLVKQTV